MTRVILLVIFTASVVLSRDSHGRSPSRDHHSIEHDSESMSEEMEHRFDPMRSSNYDCRRKSPGRCVPLMECPVIHQKVATMPRMYLYQALSEYTCGLGDSIRVCCPVAITHKESGSHESAYSYDRGNNRDQRPMQSQDWRKPQPLTNSHDDDRGILRTTQRPQSWGDPHHSEEDAGRVNSWSRPIQQDSHHSEETIGSWNRPDNHDDSPTQRPFGSSDGLHRPQQYDDDRHRPSDYDRFTERPTNTWNRPEGDRHTSAERDPWSRPNSNGHTRPNNERDPWNNNGQKPNSDRDQWNQPDMDRHTQRPNPDRDSWKRPSNDEYDRPTTKRPNMDRHTQRPTTDRDTWSRPSTTERDRYTPNEDSSSNNDRENHRNRRLLPDSCGADVLANKVLYGKDTALGEYPWLALVRIRLPGGTAFHGCGGSLINQRYVLTAAHCVRLSDSPSAKVDQVRLGEHDTRKDPDCIGSGEMQSCSARVQNIDVEKVIVHPGYRPNSKEQRDDIALLRLKRPADTSTSSVKPICLPLGSRNARQNNESMWVAGWGRTSNDPNSNSPILQKVSLPVVPASKCAPIYARSAYKLTLADTQMCAGGRKEDSCRGDSGGPLMSLNQVGASFQWQIQGIVSIGPKDCGTIGQPGIYTRVSKYTTWIMDNISA